MKRSVIVSIVLALALMAMGASARTTAGPANFPLFFEAAAPGQYSASGPDYLFSIHPNGAQVVLGKSSGNIEAIRMQLVGADAHAVINGENQLPGKINYLIGTADQWHTGVPTFSRVHEPQVYPGIDVVYHGDRKQLEYDFEVAPGADPRAIALRFDGAQQVRIERSGNLVLTLKHGEIRQPAPELYQVVDGERRKIDGGFKLLTDRTVGFHVGNYDHSQPLTIDPTLAFSTYFGGTSGDLAWAVARGSDGSLYVGGSTLSKRFYTNDPDAFDTDTNMPFSTIGADQETFAGGKVSGDGFLAKFDSTAGTLLYLTYLGGSQDEYISGIAVDTGGDAYVAGFTDSTNFPTTNALFSAIAGKLNKKLHAFLGDAFVAEVDPSGSNLLYSTYLGGNSTDTATGIAIDSAGDAYLTGFTESTNFPVTAPLQLQMILTNVVHHPHFTNQIVVSTNIVTYNHLIGTNNAFVAEIGPGGSPLLFSSYLGGCGFDVAEGIAVDSSGYIYISGYTDSTNFPTTNYLAFTNINIGITNQPVGTNVINGGLLNGMTNRSFPFDAFVTKLQPVGGGFAFFYSTLLGGNNNDYGYRVACDANGNAYVTGYSTSTNFPNTAFGIPGIHSFVETNRNFSLMNNKDAFITKITNDVSGQAGIGYSALFGGKGDDVGYGVAVDNAGEAFVTGYTISTNFPIAGAIQTNLTENLRRRTFATDVFVTAFNADASAFLYSTYFGGVGFDYGYNIAVDPANGDAFVVGSTSSTNFPTLNAAQPFRNGTNDAFLFEIQP